MLQLPAALTQTTANRCLAELMAALATEPAGVVLNAAGLNRFDSAALAVLLGLRRQAQQLGKTFAIAGLPAPMADLAQLYGITELLPMAKAT